MIGDYTLMLSIATVDDLWSDWIWVIGDTRTCCLLLQLTTCGQTGSGWLVIHLHVVYCHSWGPVIRLDLGNWWYTYMLSIATVDGLWSDWIWVIGDTLTCCLLPQLTACGQSGVAGRGARVRVGGECACAIGPARSQCRPEVVPDAKVQWQTRPTASRSRAQVSPPLRGASTVFTFCLITTKYVTFAVPSVPQVFYNWTWHLFML